MLCVGKEFGWKNFKSQVKLKNENFLSLTSSICKKLDLLKLMAYLAMQVMSSLFVVIRKANPDNKYRYGDCMACVLRWSCHQFKSIISKEQISKVIYDI